MALTDTSPSLDDVIAAIGHEKKQGEARELDALFRRVTGWKARIWPGSMIGYGSYAYRYESGHSGETLATGFASRKTKHTIYIMPGYGNYGAVLERLGKHTMGKSCLYINKLADVDLTVLEELVRFGLADLGQTHTIVGS